MNGEERIRFEADGLVLEGMLALPAGPVADSAHPHTRAPAHPLTPATAVVLCHPHPQYGGNMDYPLVRVVAEQLQRAGVATLRFNFRGVGLSQGSYGDMVGECADARAAVDLLAERARPARIVLAGYSFGAVIALRVGAVHPRVEHLIAIAPPLAVMPLDFLGDCRKPKLLLAGDRDQYCPIETFTAAVESLPPPKASARIGGADHFLAGFEREVAEHVVRFVGSPAADAA